MLLVVHYLGGSQALRRRSVLRLCCRVLDHRWVRRGVSPAGHGRVALSQRLVRLRLLASERQIPRGEVKDAPFAQAPLHKRAVPLLVRNDLEHVLGLFVLGRHIDAQIDLQLVQLGLRAIALQLRHVVFDVLLQLLQRLVGIDLNLKVQLLCQLQINAHC